MTRHTLIIGVTGMLKSTSVALAAAADTLTSVARTTNSLNALNAALADFSGTHHLLKLDWNDQHNFLNSLKTHINKFGVPSLVVAWLHEDKIGLDIARLCSSEQGTCRFFQVRGSEGGAPHADAESFANQFENLPGLRYHQVILGFVRTRTGSRWLRNSEISDGVLQATITGAPISIIGVVEPWDARPRA